MRRWINRVAFGCLAFGWAALAGAVPDAAAGDAPTVAASCAKPIEMTCKSSEDKSITYGSCEADVMLVQQGPNTHIYGCELRIRPRLLDGLSVDVQILKGKSFRLRSVKFNSELQPGESQVAITAVRPIKKTKPAKVRALIQVSGITKK
jgi:hypothetical protein